MINQDVISAFKAVVFVFLALNVIAISVTLLEKKGSRLKWKVVFKTVLQTFVIMLIAGVVVYGLSLLLLKP